MALRPGPLAAAFATAALLAGDARAGIRPYLWTWDTQTIPQGDIELEGWLWVRGHIDAVKDGAGTVLQAPLPATYWTWFSPVIGVTNQLELAFPFQMAGNGAGFNLESFEVDARYRFFSRNDRGPLQPLLRVAFHQAIRSAAMYSRAEVNAVLSWGALSEFHATADVGARVFLPFLWTTQPVPVRVQLTYAAGASYPFTEYFRAGVEVFGELDVANGPAVSDLPHHFAGLNASFTFARGWITVGMLKGLTATSPNFMPRLIWAVAL
jgi:hypothetical protein